MSVNTEALLEMKKILPYSGYCHGAERSNEEMIDLAIEHGFDKVQLVGWHPYNKAMVEKCHAHGIKVNFCQADTPEDAKMIFNMGVDCVLTNDYHFVKAGLEEYGML